jgi:dTDP-4-dehydrorhamnose 3,5-epimerase-like enzyme
MVEDGFAHGYFAMSEKVRVLTINSHKYSEKTKTISYKDPDLAINWPIYQSYPILVDPIISEKDANGTTIIKLKNDINRKSINY